MSNAKEICQNEIRIWFDKDSQKLRLTDNRSNTFIWQSEVMRVSQARDDDGTYVLVLDLANGFAIRMIHDKSFKRKIESIP